MGIMSIKIIVILILFLILPLFNFAQDIRFEHLTTNEGLSHSWVSCIYQDNQGFMWFGTFDGLNKFDGYDFIVYQHDVNNPNTLPSNVIRSICEDHSGNLWIATMEGLCFYDRRKDIFINYNKGNGYDLENLNIWNIFYDSRRLLWIGTNHVGLYQYDPSKNQQVYFPYNENDITSLSHSNVRQVFEDSKGHLWIATNNGLNIFNHETNTFTRIIHDEKNNQSIIGNTISAITEDSEGNLWFACYGYGLSTIHVDDIHTKSFINYQHNPKISSSLASNLVLSLYPDKNDGLWIGTENGGLDLLKKGETTFMHFKYDQNDPNSLNNNSIYTIYKDNAGDIWIGTYAGGVNIIKHKKQAFKHFKNLPGKPHSLSSNAVWKFHEDMGGNIWIATDGGLNKYSPKTGYFECYNSTNSNLNSDALLTVYIDSENDVWIGTWAGGISRFSRETKLFETFTSENSNLSNNNVFDIGEDEEGNLWLATHRGLNKYNKRKKTFIYYSVRNSTIPNNFLEVLLVDHKNHILIGSSDGFLIFNPETETFNSYTSDPKNNSYISNNFITSIFNDGDSIVWIGTIDGLNRLNRKTDQITRYFKSDGLISNLIFAIEKDDEDCLWISANDGISRFNLKTEQFKNFTKDDGLQGKTFIKKSSYIAKNGIIYFGGDNGFNQLDPKEVIENKAIPPIVITDFQIFNKPVKVGVDHSPLNEHISFTKELTLSYKQSVFSFKYAALNYISSSKNQYAYMLEGFNPDWNYVGTGRVATYTNINPGKYMFRVKGSNNDGYWNKKGTAVKIIITPPFWGTWWFRLIIILLVVLVIVIGHKIRTARILAYNRELEQHVKERTIQLEEINKELEAFSYSVSHDLRTPLRGINGFSQALLEDYGEKLDKQGKEYLNRIRRGSKRMGELIENLLKLSRFLRIDMNFTHVNLSHLVKSIIEEYKTLNPGREIECMIANNLFVKGDATLLRIMLMNLIDNAWKFTSKLPNAVIEFGSAIKYRKKVFYIRDNGVGFNTNISDKLFNVFERQHLQFEGSGIGLSIVQRIINRHHGSIWAEGKENQGATFYFTIGEKI
jgi:ligand-binding sensor domain-containing protein/signal transduction histidine kinase